MEQRRRGAILVASCDVPQHGPYQGVHAIGAVGELIGDGNLLGAAVVAQAVAPPRQHTTRGINATQQ